MVQKDRNNKPFYNDHSELTAIWNRLRRGRYGQNSGGGSIGGIEIIGQDGYFDDAWIDPEDESIIVFQKSPITIPSITLDSINQNIPSDRFIYNIEVDPENNHKLLLYTKPVPAGFELQPATTETLGGIKIGTGLEMDSNNKLNVVFPEPISLAGYVNSISGTPQNGYYISNVTKTDSASGSNLQFTYEKLPETDLSNYYTKTESNEKFMIAANFPELRKIETISTGTASGRLTRNSDGTWRFDNNVYLVQNDLKNLIFQKNGTDSITYIPTTGISVNIKDLILNIKDKHTGSLIGAAFHYNPLDGGSLDISIPTHTGDLTDDGLWVLKAGDTMTGPLVIGSVSNRKNLTVYGTSTFYNSVTTNGLYVPTAAPSTLLDPIPTNTIPFWLGDGEYGSGQGSGGGGGETLTITISSGAGTTTYSYNGSSAVSVPISIPSTLSQLNGTTELVKLETGLEAAGNSAGFIKRYLDTTTNTYKYQVDTAAYATTTYVDNAVTGATKYKGTFNASDGTVNGTSDTFTTIAEKTGYMYKVSDAGTYLGATLQVGDSIIFINDVATGTAPTSADVSFIEADVPVSAGTSILQWNTEVTLATVDGLAIKAKLPTEPTDTKDTTGATQDTAKLYLVGAKEQGTTQNPYKVTYSNSSVYMQNGTLYSNRSAVLTSHGPSYGKITPGSTSNATTAPSSPSKTQIVAPVPNSNFNIVPLNKWIDVSSSTSNNEQTINLWHALSSVSGSATGNGTATNGLSFSIPYVGWDAAGHVTSWGNRTHSITGAQIATALNNQTVANLTITNLTVPGTLFVPAHVPGSTGEDANATAEFWLADGEYGSVSGSGGGGGEMLTITVSSGSGTTTYNYNGSSAVSVPISIPSSLSQLSGTTELVKIENAAATGNGIPVRNNTNGQWTFDNNYLNAISPTNNTGTARPYISNITKSGHTLSITYGTLPADYQLPSELAAINTAATASSGTTTGYLKRTGTNTWSFVNETYSLSTHNHDSVYVKKTDISTGLNLNSSTGAVTLAKATTSTLGGIIISNALTGSVTLTEAAGTTENRYYGVQVDKDGKAFVNIPWTDTHNSHKVDFTAVAGTANTLTFGETFTAVVSINDTTSSTGTMTANYTTVAFTMPTETTLSLGTTSGEGNVVTGISVSNHQITMTKGITALTANDHKALTLKVGSTTVGNDYTSLVAKEYTITKSHLTGAIDSGGGYYVKKEGDTMTGPLTIAGNSNPARNADLTVLGTATFSGILNVPMHAPGSTGQDATSTSSFWLGPGEYGSSQGSGGGGGETLTISVTNSSGTTTYNYNGSSAVSVPISIPTSLSMLSGTTELQKIEYLAQSGGGFLTRNSSNGTWSWDTDTYNSIKQAIPYIEGPATDTTAGTWTGTYDGITALEEGLTIIYVPHVAGASTTTLNINGLGAKTCYYSGTSKLTTHYPVGTPILFTYHNNGWTRADYNSDVYVRVYRQTTGYDDDYPIILSRTKSPGTAGSNGTYSAVYGLMGDTNQPTINPMTGEMKAVKVTATTLQGSLGWSYLTGKPTTLAGYGITDAKIANGTITLGSNSITPLTSFTETDPTVPSWAKATSKPSYAFSEITNKPTTLSGYGITDAKISGGTITLGSNTITPLTNNVPEAYLTWGGKNFSASYGPVDAALVGNLGANRFAFGKAVGIEVEYSRDNGTTWIDYGATDEQKVTFISGQQGGFTIGKAVSGDVANANYQLRVRISTTIQLYTILNKFIMYVGTNGTTGNWCTISKRLKSDQTADIENWTVVAEKIPISGWSGWNVINTPGITFGNGSGQFGQLEFLFGCTSYNGNGTTQAGLAIYRLFAFGGQGWTTPSKMAEYGHLYNYNWEQDMILPSDLLPVGNLDKNIGDTSHYWKNIYANKFIVKNGTSSQFLKADGSLDSNTYLTSETPLSKGTTTGTGNAVTDISVSGHTITLTKGTTFLTAHQTLTNHAKLADTTTANQLMVSSGSSAYSWKSYRTLTLQVGGAAIGSGYDPFSSANVTLNITKANLTTALESAGGYYVKKSGDTMTGDLNMYNGSDISWEGYNEDPRIYVGTDYDNRRDSLQFEDGFSAIDGTAATNNSDLTHIRRQRDGGTGYKSKIWDAGNFNPVNYLSRAAGVTRPLYSDLYFSFNTGVRRDRLTTATNDISIKYSTYRINSSGPIEPATTYTAMTMYRGGSLDIGSYNHSSNLVGVDLGIYTTSSGNIYIGDNDSVGNDKYSNIFIGYDAATDMNSISVDDDGFIELGRVENIVNLAVPASSPINPVSGTTYFWLGDGEYGSSQGTGGGGGENLTITVNGTSTIYNGSAPQAVTISIPTMLSQLGGTSELVKIQTAATAGNPAGFLTRSGGNWIFESTSTYATKTYVDQSVAGATMYRGTYNANTNKISSGINNGKTFTEIANRQGDMYKVNVAGTYLSTTLQVGDSIIFISDVTAGTAPTADDVSFVEADVSVSDGNPTLAWGTQSIVGTVEGVNLHVTLPSETTLSKGTTTGTGNAVTDISVSNHTITLTKGTTFLTSANLTAHAKVSDTSTASQVLVSTGSSAYSWKTYRTLTLQLAGTTIGSAYDPFGSANSTINFTKANLTTALESDNGYYVKKSGDTMSGSLTITGSGTYIRLSQGDAYFGTQSGAQCHVKYDATNEGLNFIFD